MRVQATAPKHPDLDNPFTAREACGRKFAEGSRAWSFGYIVPTLFAGRGFSLNQQALSAFIWSVADLLRGDYKQADYGKVKRAGSANISFSLPTTPKRASEEHLERPNSRRVAILH